MPTNPNTADSGKPWGRWFQFSLMTMFVVMAAFGLLLTQWPLVEWEHVRPNSADYPGLMLNEIDHLPAARLNGRYYVPMRVWQVVAAYAIAIAGWQLLARMRRRRIEQDGRRRS
jgi:hypothetical protein